jgi:hypothetical protein
MDISIQGYRNSFCGKIITKGKWTEKLRDCFVNNNEVKKLASGRYNIIGDMRLKKASKNDIYHNPNENLYKLKITAMRENPTILDKIKYFLRLIPSINLTRFYHSETTTQNRIDSKINAETYKSILNLF